VHKQGLENPGRSITARWGAVAAVVGLFSLTAQGQPGQMPTGAGPSSDTVVPWAAGHRWTRAGLDEGVSRLTVSTSGTVLALTERGAVWRLGGEQSWRMVLGPPGARLDDPEAIDEEQLLLDAESLLDERVDFSTSGTSSSGGGESSTGDEDSEDERDGPVPLESGDGLQGEGADDLFVQGEDDLDRRGRVRPGETLWAAMAVPGLILCDRGDGTWRSVDDGLTWEQVDGLDPAHAFTDQPGSPGVVVAGTEAGLRTSLDGGMSWIQVQDPLGEVPVYSFATDTKRLWAGTEEGLFVSTSQVGWAKLVPRRDADMPVWTVAADPYWENGLWLAGPVGILRTDDGGQTSRPAGRNPLVGTRVTLPLDAPGHVLSAGRDGVWESLDGGIQWRPLARGLPYPRVATAVRGTQGILVGGSDGVFVLRRAVLTPEADLVGASRAHEKEPPMGELVEAALRRPGMRIDSVLTHQNLIASMMLPKLTLTGRWDRYRYITADHEAKTNKGGRHHGWFVGATACFGNCASSVGFSDVDVASLAEDYGVDIQSLPELAVVGDEVYVADSAGSLAPVAANVAERLTQYRSEVASRVSELTLSRRRLVDARADVRALSLKDQAAHELRIMESAARIDVYTNGYFTRVLEGS